MLAPIGAAAYPALAAAALLGAAGAPLPVSATLAAAGALARQGRLDLTVAFVTATAAAVAGDCLGYAAGRYGLRRLPLGGRSTALVARLRLPLQGDGHGHIRMGLLLFLTRWALTAPASLVNVLAGARRYPWRAFLFFDLAGQALWSLTALALGYSLGENGGIGVPVSIGAGLALSLLGILLARRRRTEDPWLREAARDGQEARWSGEKHRPDGAGTAGAGPRATGRRTPCRAGAARP